MRYPGAVQNLDTGAWISDAEVAEIYTVPAGTDRTIASRLIVRRVKDRNDLDELFPAWRCDPTFTDSTETVTDADITHRQQAPPSNQSSPI